jgi:hypothetical protein
MTYFAIQHEGMRVRAVAEWAGMRYQAVAQAASSMREDAGKIPRTAGNDHEAQTPNVKYLDATPFSY